jgi:hypothetical protein
MKSPLRIAMPRCISRAHRVDDAGEFDQDAIAGSLDDATAIALDRWIDQLDAQRGEAAYGPFLVGAGQPRIARDIRREDRRQFALNVLGCHAALRRGVLILPPLASLGGVPIATTRSKKVRKWPD